MTVYRKVMKKLCIMHFWTKNTRIPLMFDTKKKMKRETHVISKCLAPPKQMLLWQMKDRMKYVFYYAKCNASPLQTCLACHISLSYDLVVSDVPFFPPPVPAQERTRGQIYSQGTTDIIFVILLITLCNDNDFPYLHQ